MQVFLVTMLALPDAADYLVLKFAVAQRAFRNA